MRFGFGFLFLLCCCCHSYGQHIVSFKGNSFTMSKSATAEVIDPVSGQKEVTNGIPQPVLVNGEPIYPVNSVTTAPVYKNEAGNEIKLSVFIFNSLKDELQQLADGGYILAINDPVIGKEGRLVYYELKGIQQLTHTPQQTTSVRNEHGRAVTFTMLSNITDDSNIPATTKARINKKIAYLLEHLPAMVPGTISNKPVNTTGELFYSGSEVKVNNHIATFIPAYFAL